MLLKCKKCKDETNYVDLENFKNKEKFICVECIEVKNVIIEKFTDEELKKIIFDFNN